MRSDRQVLTLHWNVSSEQFLSLSLSSLRCNREKSRRNVCLHVIPSTPIFIPQAVTSNQNFPNFMYSLPKSLLSLRSDFNLTFFMKSCQPFPSAQPPTIFILCENKCFCAFTLLYLYSSIFQYVYGICTFYGIWYCTCLYTSYMVSFLKARTIYVNYPWTCCA